MRVEPPTRITWSISPLVSPASLIACSNGLLAALEQVGGQLLELGPGELLVEVQRAVGGGGDERQVDLGLLHLRQLDLGLLGRLLQALHGHVVLGQVDAVVVLERRRPASR